MLRLDSNEVLHLGLKFVSHKSHRQKHNTLVKNFRKYYRVEPKVLAKQWNDLCRTDLPDARVAKKNQNERGFKMFMACHYFLFTYPKNAQVFATNFQFGSTDMVSGKKLWSWLGKIAALQHEKIIWPEERYKNPNSAKYVVTVDCVDCHIREPKHPEKNIDTSYSSHKFKKAGLRYELGIDVHHPSLVWLSGPHKAGSDSDKIIFKQKDGLRDKLKKLVQYGKKGIADGGYEGHEKYLSLSSTLDKGPVREFKSRARSRHEGFNSEIKKYRSMATYWEQGRKKHGIAFRAVCVTLQYAMENGSPLFDV